MFSVAKHKTEILSMLRICLVSKSMIKNVGITGYYSTSSFSINSKFSIFRFEKLLPNKKRGRLHSNIKLPHKQIKNEKGFK
jgi:hypothetical protein